MHSWNETLGVQNAIPFPSLFSRKSRGSERECQLAKPGNCKFPNNFQVALKYLLSVGEGNGTPLQYSYLENPMDGGAW